ncbi:MAG TPA: tyrosine-type recombinase/integrase, partial [Chryseolinea sp.]|nr:tyrosine-type recombinase/integrase [Chryseolinea sp.]
GYPYRKARSVQSNGTWYIIFYVWDIGKKEMVRKRVAKNDLNDCRPDQRQIISRKYIDDINFLLHHDAYVESDIPKAVVNSVKFTNFTFIEAINWVKDYKRDVEHVKKATIKEYISTRTTVEDFYQASKTSKTPIPANYKLRDVNDAFVDAYFTYLKTVRMSSNKTHNNKRGFLHTVCEVVLKKDPDIFRKGINPFASVDILKTESRKHAAYSDEQMKCFASAMKKGKEPHVLLFMQFMFYTLARPEELRLLKVGHIRLEDRRILFLSQNSKTSIEQYIGINDRFAEIIRKSKIMEYPHDHYVFASSNGLKSGNVTDHPGKHPVGTGYFCRRVTTYIKELGFRKINPNYTMYGFKHSGAISLYKATKDIKLLQEQCRHQTIEQTNTYLRDIGLFSDLGRLNKWNGPL